MLVCAQERLVARTLRRGEHSVSVGKVALPLWRSYSNKRETYEDQVRLELEYLQK